MRAIRSLWWLCHVPFDVGEEEGDSARGEIGHDPVPYMPTVVVLADCRMAEGRLTSERLTIASSVSCPWAEQVEHILLRFTADDALAMAAD